MKKYIPVFLCGMLLGFQGVHAEEFKLNKESYEAVANCIIYAKVNPATNADAAVAESCIDFSNHLAMFGRSGQDFISLAAAVGDVKPSHTESWFESLVVVARNLSSALESDVAVDKWHLSAAACYQLNQLYRKYSKVSIEENERCS